MANLPELWKTGRFGNTFREMARYQERMDKLMNEMISGSGEPSALSLDFSPSCELVEEERNFLLRVDLPGVTKDNVKVEIDADRLTIHAERHEEKETKTRRRHLSEISYGSYVRTFQLPQVIDEKMVKASFTDGVLKITIPKTEATKAKQISIQ